jgi:imidazolonepropionase-like amidohydrolase
MGWRACLRPGLCALAFLTAGAAAPPEPALFIRGARIFDGTGAPASVGNVLIRGERIVAAGPAVRPPRRARVVDARGLTLIPGLHDLHAHLRSPALDGPDDLGKAYAGYLLNGITSVSDFSVSGEMLAPIRNMVASGAVAAPRLSLAVRLGVPGGHGTEYGWGRFFTLQAATPRAAHLAMARALPYRPDVVKVFADGWRYGRSPSLNSMDAPTLAAIVEEAHAAGLPVITHTVTLEGARLAAAAGVDALGHGIGDALVDDALISLMKARGTAYIPTLVTYEPQQDRRFDPAEWRRLRPTERAREEALRAAPAPPVPELESRRWTIMRENVRRLKAAGIPIGIGTDAGIGGVYHGTATLREIGWLAKLGFTPAEALRAATAISAGILRKGGDQGRIAPGYRADLVLTGGRPDERIGDVYDVRRVFVAGREMPLKRLAGLADDPAMSPLPARPMAGPIYTGIAAAGRTDLDTRIDEATERGVDHSHIDIVQPGEGSPRPLLVVARMGAAPQPFAELVLPLTRGGIALADARRFAGVAFEARGGGRHALRIDSYGIQPGDRFEAPFAAGDTLAEIRIPFSAFRSRDPEAKLDLARLRALVVRLQGEPGGTAWFELGSMRFY